MVFKSIKAFFPGHTKVECLDELKHLMLCCSNPCEIGLGCRNIGTVLGGIKLSILCHPEVKDIISHKPM